MSVYIVSFFTAFFVAFLLKSMRGSLIPLDVPTHRSLHDSPKPRLGGVAIIAGVSAGWLLFSMNNELPVELALVIKGAALIALVSLVDDYITFSQIGRLFVHIIASLLFMCGTLHDIFNIYYLVLIFFSMIWMINLYNFMDGMDGFAGGMSFLGFSFLAFAAYSNSSQLMASYMLIVAVSSLGFLLLNFPPAKIFMGDVGSVTIGYLVAAFSVWGIRDGVFPFWYPLLVFSPFIVDATLTIFRRLLNKEPIWVPHRRHYYQRVVQSGWSHCRTVIHEYLLMLLCGFSAFLMLKYQCSTFGAIIWIILYAIIVIWVDKLVCKKTPFISPDSTSEE